MALPYKVYNQRVEGFWETPESPSEPEPIQEVTFESPGVFHREPPENYHRSGYVDALSPTLYISQDEMNCNSVEIVGDNIKVVGNMHVHGTLEISGNLIVEDMNLHINKSTGIDLFDIQILDGKIYLAGKHVTNPSSLGLHMMQKINELYSDDIIKNEDLFE